MSAFEHKPHTQEWFMALNDDGTPPDDEHWASMDHEHGYYSVECDGEPVTMYRAEVLWMPWRRAWWGDNEIKHKDLKQPLVKQGVYVPPTLTPDGDPEWAQEYREMWDREPPIALCEGPGEWWVSLYESGDLHGGWTEFPEEAFAGLTPEKLREIAAIFNTAADWQELQQSEKQP